MPITKDKDFLKSLVRLSVPISFQNLITFAAGFVNALLISPLGDTACAGVYIGNQVHMLVSLVTAGVESAILVLGSSYHGRAEGGMVRKIASCGTKIALAVGILSMIVCIFLPDKTVSLFTDKENIVDTGGQYLRIIGLSFPFFCLSGGLIFSLRSVETAGIGTAASILSLAVNIALGIPLINGRIPGLPSGVSGLAVATVAARACEAIAVMIYTFVFDKKLSLRPLSFLAFDGGALKELFRFGAPLVAAQLVWAVNIFSGAAILARLDGEGVVAAVGVATALYNLSYSTANGLSAAVGILVGKAGGEGNAEKIKSFTPAVMRISLAVGLLSAVLVLLLKSPFISLYRGLSPGAVSEAGRMILAVSAIMPFSHYQAAALFGLIRGGGDVKFLLITDLALVFLLTLPAGITLCRLGAPPWAVFASLRLEQAVKCLIARIKVRKFDWIKSPDRCRR